MALWRLDRENGRVSLSYIEKPFDQEPEVRDCGESDEAVLPDLTEWVCQSADPFDMVEMPDGNVFVRHRVERHALVS